MAGRAHVCVSPVRRVLDSLFVVTRTNRGGCVAEDAARALSELTDDERMFRESVREFAADRVTPLVRAMDEAQQMDAGLVREMFALGLLGIVVPEEFGGAGGSFFDAVLAVEA